MNWLNQALIKLPRDTYLNFLLFIAPFFNFIAGVNLDLYTPSMPAIAQHYGTSVVLVKNTVTATLCGIALGCFLMGILLDAFGRRRIMLIGLLCYAMTSFLAPYCHTIAQLLFVRFLQGLTIASVTVGARSLIIDSFTGHRFTVGLLYVSLGYGLGPIVAPFVGGLVQEHWGWQANFILYGCIGLFGLLIFFACVSETLVCAEPFSLKTTLNQYKTVLKHPIFISAVCIGGVGQVALMTYSTVAAFIVEVTLHHNAIVYGNTALLVGGCYLLGTLSNRIFVKKFHLHHIADGGFLLLLLAIILQISFALFATLTLWTLVIPVMLICYSQGFIFPNVMISMMKYFSQHGSTAPALSLSLLIVVCAILMWLISFIAIKNLLIFASIFAVVAVLEALVFYCFFKPRVAS